jgi:glycine cleavage system aminomethyltransferase T
MNDAPRPPAEFDFPLSWSGPDGIGASPFDEFAEAEAPDVSDVKGDDPAVALRKNVALCRMAVQYSELGTAVEVGKLDGLQKRIPAQVVRFPFYDPDKTRPRS